MNANKTDIERINERAAREEGLLSFVIQMLPLFQSFILKFNDIIPEKESTDDLSTSVSPSEGSHPFLTDLEVEAFQNAKNEFKRLFKHVEFILIHDGVKKGKKQLREV
jgi:hypothetical protein